MTSNNNIPSRTLLSPNIEQLKSWSQNRLVNPITKRKIKQNGRIYIYLNKLYNEYQEQCSDKQSANINLLCGLTSEAGPNKVLGESLMADTNSVLDNSACGEATDLISSNFKSEKKILDYVDRYLEYRNKKIDPLLMTELPLDNFHEDLLFKFPYKWNSYTGERLDKDKNGILYFDPDTLIQHFYINRLNRLWIAEEYINNECYEGYYGDAMGKGPDFFIKGRGYHPDWYLFRLPITDGYLHKDHCEQSVTMGPILTNKEIKEIDKLAKKYKNNYVKRFGQQRPSLIKLKQLYDSAIDSNPNLNIPDEIIDILEPEYITQLNFDYTSGAIEKLKQI